MKKGQKEVVIGGKKCKLSLLYIEKSDRKKIKDMYSDWRKLSNQVKNFSGRFVNIPEALSESAFCLEFNSARVLGVSVGASSFDTIDLKTNARQQIKATSVKDDLTSFGPKSVWDELYFLDFFRKGKWDGSFDVYKIPNKYITGQGVSKTQLFTDQQKEKRRPRFSIKKNIIRKLGLKPIKTCRI